MSRRQDSAYMEMAYGLAEKARGRTSPNPLVGAVVVRRGVIVGHGFHEKAGRPHAEIMALEGAGRRARGATLFVTLEPCVHWGRTPPCVDRVVSAGLARVIISARDPNPLVHDKGIRSLEEAGLSVSVGLLEERNARLNEAYVKHITRKTPLVTLKAALTLDGKIACRTGDSRWISSEAARDYVHLLRGEQDALMVGANTILRDDPRLTVRHPGWAGKRLVRIVLDSRLRVPPAAKILKTLSRGPILIFSGSGADESKARILARAGVEVVRSAAARDGIPLAAVLAELGRREIASVLVEGGSRLFTSFIENGLADKLVLTFSPKLVGGREAPGFFEGEGLSRVRGALKLRDMSYFPLGDEFIVEGRF